MVFRPRAMSLVTPLLLGLGVTACGDDIPTASVSEFCAVLEDEIEPEIGDDNGDWIDDLDEVGVPDTMGEEAREGRELYLDLLREHEDDGEDFDLDTLTDDERSRYDAFWEYGTDNCNLYIEDE